MILPVHQLLRSRVSGALQRLYTLDPDSVPALVIEVPPRRALGDLAMPFAFELARRLRKAPRTIALEVVAALEPMDGIARVEATSNGYVNAYLDRAAFLRARLAPGGAAVAGAPAAAAAAPGKTIVEHTAINPNKAAHIGHLRNAALGDTLVRLLRFAGRPVEVQNYIDDTGVQVADVVVGFQHLDRVGLDAVRRLSETTRFDYHCWDLYARVTEWYEADKARLDVRGATLHAIEHGEGEAAAMGHLIADRIVRCHLETMGRLNVDYDLLTWEGDILRLQFWARCFEILKSNGSVFYQDEGRLAGCWVMRIEEEGDSGPADPESPGEGDDAEQREKVIVRSNGTVTYVGKDIAYQFWKMGLLGRDFGYRRFGTRLDGAPLWATTSEAGAPHGGEHGVPRFGGAEATFNVIDTRQSYLQKLLKQALHTMGHTQEAARSTHFAYEMVALSHATARALGYDAAVQADRPFVEVSGRKGLGVKADDLLDRLVEQARGEVVRRNPDLEAGEVIRTARSIAVAALRYFMVKFSRTKIIAFDMDEALSFEGESGPYLQYAAVRAANIYAKLTERLGVDEASVIATLPALDPAALEGGEAADDLWGLVLEAARLDEMVEQALRALEPSLLVKWAFGLAQAFNTFYQRYPILSLEDEPTRTWRAAAVAYFRRQITAALDLIGSSVPARM
jgi:arginyl-tRNA synthetase